MFQKKSKGLFAEVSHYQVRLARTDRTVAPLQVEAVESIPITTTEETKNAIIDFAGDSKSGYIPAQCTAYPAERFIFRHYQENATRTKQDDFAEKTLQGQVKAEMGDIRYRILHPATGKTYNPDELLSRETLFVGTTISSLKDEQKRLIDLGLYPNRLEISSVSLYAGIKKALTEKSVDSSVLVVEFADNASYGYVVGTSGLALSHPINFGISSVASSIQSELGLHDALSARKVMLSKTFDFRDMGATLLRSLILQVRASTGQFEVQTGKSVHYIFIPDLPDSLSWVGEILAEELGMEVWKPSLDDWSSHGGIELSSKTSQREDLPEFFPLFCQMAQLEAATS